MLAEYPEFLSQRHRTLFVIAQLAARALAHFCPFPLSPGSHRGHVESPEGCCTCHGCVKEEEHSASRNPPCFSKQKANLFSVPVENSTSSLKTAHSIQSLSRVRHFATPCIAARQASLSITNSQSSPKLMRTPAWSGRGSRPSRRTSG